MTDYLNFSTANNLDVSGHKDIDFVDIFVNTDVSLFLDAERIEFSSGECAEKSLAAIQDFFRELYTAVEYGDMIRVRHLLSGGGECNELHLGYSTKKSRGRGSSENILLPIILQMIRQGYFNRVQKLSDFPLWADNFGEDRCSDLIGRLIRMPLYEYTREQCIQWGCLQYGSKSYSGSYWDVSKHNWASFEVPQIVAANTPILLCPQTFVGTRLLTSAENFFRKFVLTQRQEDLLAERSPLCHFSLDKHGFEKISKPTKSEICQFEVKGQSHKSYSYNMLEQHPHLLSAYHLEHKYNLKNGKLFLTPQELDYIVYGKLKKAI